jgi:hypothetical protein
MIMRKIFALVLASSLLVPAMAATGDMSVATFLAKADALKAKGFGALGSPDIKLLRDEGMASGAAYRARIESDKKAGRAPHSCPPKKAAMKSDDFIAHLRSYPVAIRPKTTVKGATFDLMKKRYPCN